MVQCGIDGRIEPLGQRIVRPTFRQVAHAVAVFLVVVHIGVKPRFCVTLQIVHDNVVAENQDGVSTLAADILVGAVEVPAKIDFLAPGILRLNGQFINRRQCYRCLFAVIKEGHLVAVYVFFELELDGIDIITHTHVNRAFIGSATAPATTYATITSFHLNAGKVVFIVLKCKRGIVFTVKSSIASINRMTWSHSNIVT